MNAILATAAGLLLLATPAPADWPQFRGPGRDGVYEGPEIAWGKDGPRRAWERAVGEGFSAPIVAGGRVIVFHRSKDREVLDCLDAATGKPVWSDAEPTAYRDDFGFDEGPRGTPSAAGGRVVAFGAEGFLRAVDLGTGKRLWGCDTRSRFAVRKGFFGAACSPLIDGDRVIVEVGGKTGGAGAGVVCFDAATGDVLWTAAEDTASYSSPVAATIAGRRQALFLTRSGLLSVDLEKGDVLFRHPWESRGASVNAATPIVKDDLVFISSSYNLGAALIRAGGKEPSLVWSGDESLSSHYSTACLREGALFGFHGRQEYSPELRAVDFASGKVLWSEKGLGSGTVHIVNGKLLVVTETGELILAAATRRAFEPLARAKALGGTVRAYPAIAGGRIYLRNEDTLVCLEASPAPASSAPAPSGAPGRKE